jgi:hypothetical protein
LAQISNRGQRKLFGRLASRNRRMRSEKDRNAANAVIEIRADGDEIGNLGIAQPVESDPRGTRSTADRETGELCRDLIGFPDEAFPCRGNSSIRG